MTFTEAKNKSILLFVKNCNDFLSLTLSDDDIELLEKEIDKHEKCFHEYDTSLYTYVQKLNDEKENNYKVILRCDRCCSSIQNIISSDYFLINNNYK